MKYAVVQTKRFRKSLKKMLRRGKDIGKLEAVVQILASGEPLPAHIPIWGFNIVRAPE